MSDFEFTNRLINEKSPYLLQHAHNPVDWYPWGAEAFEKAKLEDKPIFLSIGYSTCHWCHVMERESFEDAQVAEILNRDFVAIKVDREERPDLDHIYMSFCQAFTGQGGWPLSVFITSERKPFFAGTYFPKNSRIGIPGFMDVLRAVTDAWGYERQTLLDQCQVILDHISRPAPVNPGLLIGLDDLDRAYEHFKKSFDPLYGGFSEAPKFPGPHVISYLLRYGVVNNQPEAMDMAAKTLDGMYRGGIYDHIGGGFSRYSTDSKWLVPHFEKMLYDNALLALAYSEAYQVLKNPEYRRIAENVLDYVLRDMVSPEGGFFSAEDADSAGVEGKFYVWEPDEIKQVLGEAEGERFCELYDITEQGNFEGMNIPNLLRIHSEHYFSEDENLIENKARLLRKRNERERPLKDDKVLTSWNGLMIAAMSKAYQVFGNQEYLQAAQNALRFVLGSLRRPDGRLLARYRQGEAAYLAYADDYAYLVWGILELYAATFNPEYLQLAIEINGDMLKLFWDNQDGGLFFSGSDAEAEIYKPKEIYDGALPSANSIAVSNLLRLSRLTDNQGLADQAEKIITAFAGKVKQFPAGYSALLSGAIWLLCPPREIVITGHRQDPVVQEMLTVGQKHFLPNTVVVSLDPDENSLWMQINPSLATRFNNDEQAAAFVCQNYACQAPVYNQEALEGLLSVSQNHEWSGKM